MLESGLLFALGFLCATLLALLVAPAIWRRAVVLTRQRIENSVPLTLNEIQADKDLLRADFAMSTRRLELRLESLQERAAGQLIELNTKGDELRTLKDDNDDLSLRISELESRTDQLDGESKEK